jgi:Spy/CpxP family protein refolding chaperone/peroxiredoxin
MQQMWVIVIALAMTSLVQAQATSRPTRTEAPASFPRFRSAISNLKLSDEQTKKIDDIFDRESEDIRAMSADLREMKPADRQAKFKEFFNDLRDDISQVLTSEQKEKFDSALQSLPGLGDRPRGATTKPGGAPGAGRAGERGFGPRAREALQQLNLTEEQKTKIKKIFEDAGEKYRQIASTSERGSEEMRSKMRELMENTRDAVKDVLTPEQMEKFTAAMRGDGAPQTQPRSIEGKMKDEKMMDEKMSSKMEDENSKSGDRQASSDSEKSSESESIATGPQAGQPAPEFSLQKLDGLKLNLSNFKGKVVVLTFGSYSSPSFRRRAQGLEEIYKRYDDRANFLLVYTKEAHPKNGWQVDRNKDENVEVPEASDMSAREQQAKQARSTLHRSWPTLIDTMDDSAAKAYGAGECTTFIIDREGKIYSRLQWSDPYTLKRQLDEILAVKPTTRPVG